MELKFKPGDECYIIDYVKKDIYKQKILDIHISYEDKKLKIKYKISNRKELYPEELIFNCKSSANEHLEKMTLALKMIEGD